MPRTRYGDLRDTFHLSRLTRNDLVSRRDEQSTIRHGAYD